MSATQIETKIHFMIEKYSKFANQLRDMQTVPGLSEFEKDRFAHDEGIYQTIISDLESINKEFLKENLETIKWEHPNRPVPFEWKHARPNQVLALKSDIQKALIDKKAMTVPSHQCWLVTEDKKLQNLQTNEIKDYDGGDYDKLYSIFGQKKA